MSAKISVACYTEVSYHTHMTRRSTTLDYRFFGVVEENTTNILYHSDNFEGRIEYSSGIGRRNCLPMEVFEINEDDSDEIVVADNLVQIWDQILSNYSTDDA